MKQVLVYRWKHGDIYYDASTPENTRRGYYEMLKFCDTEGRYFEPKLEKTSYSDEERELLSISPEVLKSMPVLFQSKYDSLLKKDLRRKKTYEEELRRWNLLRETLNMTREEAILKTVVRTYTRSTGEVVRKPYYDYVIPVLVDYFNDGTFTLEDVEEYN